MSGRRASHSASEVASRCFATKEAARKSRMSAGWSLAKDSWKTQPSSGGGRSMPRAGRIVVMGRISWKPTAFSRALNCQKLATASSLRSRASRFSRGGAPKFMSAVLARSSPAVFMAQAPRRSQVLSVGPAADAELFPPRSATDAIGESGGTMTPPTASEWATKVGSPPFQRWWETQNQSVTMRSTLPESSARLAASLSASRSMVRWKPWLWSSLLRRMTSSSQSTLPKERTPTRTSGVSANAALKLRETPTRMSDRPRTSAPRRRLPWGLPGGPCRQLSSGQGIALCIQHGNAIILEDCCDPVPVLVDEAVDLPLPFDLVRPHAHGDVEVHARILRFLEQRRDLQLVVVALGVVAGDGPPQDRHVDSALGKIVDHDLARLVEARIDHQRIGTDIAHQPLLDDEIAGRGAGGKSDPQRMKARIAQMVDVEVVAPAGDDDVAGTVI